MAGKWRWNTAQFAERKWWQRYLKNKDVAEYHVWKKNYWKNLLLQCAPYFKVSSQDVILDAGCGPAGMFMIFPENKVVAFDPLVDSYEQDLPHFKKSMYPNVSFINVGLEEFNSNEKFDTIFCMNAINHVHDIELSFDNLVEPTKKGTHIVVTIDAHNHSIFKHLFRLLPGDILHPHQYDLKEYESFLTRRNCKILASIHLKKEFFFDHYMLVAERL